MKPTSWEVLHVRKVKPDQKHGDYVVTLLEYHRPSWWQRLLGKRTTTSQRVYIGSIYWWDAATGLEVDWNTSAWLERYVDGQEAIKAYKESLEDQS